jgi:hypothetical protein
VLPKHERLEVALRNVRLVDLGNGGTVLTSSTLLTVMA